MQRRNFFKSISLLPISLFAGEEMSLVETPELENILEYTTMRITFPFENADENHSRYIYNQTLQLIMHIDEKEVMIHCGNKNGALYDANIDAFLCFLGDDTTTELWYPSLDLLHKSKILDLPNMSLVITMQYLRLTLKCSEHSMFITTKDINKFFDKPPCAVNELKIEIEGDLKFYDISRPDKRFDLRNL